VEETITRILDSRRIMAISTVRPDGWPQTTIVGYANDGLDVYFVIFRSSQKFANIQRDDRVSIAVGEEPRDLRELKAVFAGAHAVEVTDLREGEHAWRLLVERHPNLAHFELPEQAETALIRATCKFVSVLDYSKGFGHSEAMTFGDGPAATAHATRTDDWGSAAARRKDG
jgi:nitroimidazol reductase NimA-like FMN-containing flavoprotein (pyridoxamine 5'-phosphate oxidase superfamily)